MKMNAGHMSPFVESAKETFSTMVGLNVQMDKLFVKDNDARFSPAVSGIIGLTGDVQGVVIIEFPLETALAVVSRLIGEEVTNIDDDVTDAIGEIANIISGSAKKDLDGLNVSIGLPTVVIGTDYVLHLSKDASSLCAAMTSDAGNFIIEISMKFIGE
jgi:chemotaxis protein CheX